MTFFPQSYRNARGGAANKSLHRTWLVRVPTPDSEPQRSRCGPTPYMFCRSCRGFALRAPRTHGWRRGLLLYRPVWGLVMMRSRHPKSLRV